MAKKQTKNVNITEDSEEQTPSVPEKNIPLDEYFGRREVAPVREDKILHERMYFVLAKSKYDSCNLIKTADGKVIGTLPMIPADRIWKIAHEYRPNDGTTLEITKQDWTDALKTLKSCAAEGKPKTNGGKQTILLQDIWKIGEMRYEECFLRKSSEVIKVLRAAVLADIAQSQAVESRWRKIKHYKHKVKLLDYYGGIFSEEDTVKLENSGIRYLNDIRKKNIYFLKNLFLDHDLSKLPEEINAAFKEDLERRKDFRYKFWPLFWGALGTIAASTIGFIFQYTLLKNSIMTYVIYGLLGFWVLLIAIMIRGGLRAKRRRKKRTGYYYFSKNVKWGFSCFVLLSTMMITALTVFYERYDGYSETYYYRNLADGEITIANLVHEEEGSLILPTEIDGKTVTAISWTAFKGAKVRSLTIPETVTRLGSSAFRDCKNLTDINIPQAVTELPDSVFEGCSALTSVDIPAGVTSIGKNAFAECAITDFTVPANVVSAGNGAFRDSMLQRIEFEGRLNFLGESAFQGCLSLTEAVCDDTSELTEIKLGTFADCPSLVSTNLFQNAEIVGKGALRGCTSLTSFELPAAKEIRREVFEGCTRLNSLTIPFLGKTRDSSDTCEYLFSEDTPVKSIVLTDAVHVGKRAFSGVKTLESVSLPDTVEDIADSAFSECTSLTQVRLPAGIKEIANNAFEQCISLMEVTNAESVERVGDYAFSECSNLQSVSFFGNLVEIGKYAFNKCRALTNVSLSRAEIIGEKAFYGCQSMATFNFPSSLKRLGREAFAESGIEVADLSKLTDTEIGPYLFQLCSRLTQLTLPTTIKSIPIGIAANCGQLQTFTIPNGVETIETDAFSRSGLMWTELPTSLKKIGEHAFFGCNFTAATVPASVETIGKEAFGGCSQLTSYTGSFLGKSASNTGDGYKYLFGENAHVTSVTLDGLETVSGSMFTGGENTLASVTLTRTYTIAKGAFENFSALNSISVGSSLTSIGANAFRFCTSLYEVSLPDSLKDIGKSAFRGSGLNIISVPGSVATIRDSAFRNCTSLTTVILGPGVKTIEANAFKDCIALTDIGLPNTLEKIGNSAFSYCNALIVVTVPDSVVEMGKNVFESCERLRALSIPFIGASRAKAKPLSYLLGANARLEFLAVTDAETIADYSFKNFTRLLYVYLDCDYTAKEKAFEDARSLVTVFLNDDRYDDTIGSSIRQLPPSNIPTEYLQLLGISS